MVKTLAATGVALLMAVSMTRAQPAATKGAQAGASSAAVNAVTAAELARFKAQTSGDLKALDALLGDDLIYTHSNAQVDSKATYVGSMSSGALTYKTIEPRDMKVRVFGNTAVITAAAHITAVSPACANVSRASTPPSNASVCM